MGLMRRLSELFRSEGQTMVDQAPDPEQALEDSAERLRELVRHVRRGVADVATSRRRLELEAERLRQGMDKLDAQARQASAANRDDLARAMLERRNVLEQQAADIDGQRAELEAEQDRLVLAEARLSAKLDALQSRTQAIGAQYTAAEAHVRIGEALSGISEEMVDAGYAVERAQAKADGMRARADALDELLAGGAVVSDDWTGGGTSRAEQLGEGGR